MPSELLANEATDEETGFKGFHLSPQVKDGYKTHIAWDWVIGKLQDSDAHSESQPTPPAVNPWTVEEEQEFQYLKDWTDEECTALGLPPVSEMDGGEGEAAAKSAAAKIKNISRENLNQ